MEPPSSWTIGRNAGAHMVDLAGIDRSELASGRARLRVDREHPVGERDEERARARRRLDPGDGPGHVPLVGRGEIGEVHRRHLAGQGDVELACFRRRSPAPSSRSTAPAGARACDAERGGVDLGERTGRGRHDVQARARRRHRDRGRRDSTRTRREGRCRSHVRFRGRARGRTTRRARSRWRRVCTACTSDARRVPWSGPVRCRASAPATRPRCSAPHGASPFRDDR